MKMISQGKYEIFTQREDAIDKFMQMQGVCRENISGENLIRFYCTKKGKITITNPPTRGMENENSTNLFATVTEQDGRTYVTYYTAFSRLGNAMKMISLAIGMLMVVLTIVFTIAVEFKIQYLLCLVLALMAFGVKFFIGAKEEKNAPKDSEILIKELEKRVEAVNLWDK